MPDAYWKLCSSKKGTKGPEGWLNPATRPPKGFTHLWCDTDDVVRFWTRLARSLGIKYHKERYYKFPKGMIAEYNVRSGIYYDSKVNPFLKEKGKMEFELLKVTGVISHKRSEASRIRRAARRAVKAVLEPLSISDVLGVRLCDTAKRRKSEFIKDKTLYPAVLDRRGKCHQAPDIVIKAIYNLFSREEAIQVIKIPGTEPVSELPRTVTQTVYKKTLLTKFLKKGMRVRLIPGKVPFVGNTTIPFIGDESEEVNFLTDSDSGLESPFTSNTRTRRLKKDVEIPNSNWW
jgi:hypothetical protein